MKSKNLLCPLAVAVIAVAALSSCKGRTMENMEPTGDTVEVTGLMPEAEIPSDTLPQNP